eukprot:scaffold91551_cov18-Tisochrysis_lutea.AAC.1
MQACSERPGDNAYTKACAPGGPFCMQAQERYVIHHVCCLVAEDLDSIQPFLQRFASMLLYSKSHVADLAVEVDKVRTGSRRRELGSLKLKDPVSRGGLLQQV